MINSCVAYAIGRLALKFESLRPFQAFHKMCGIVGQLNFAEEEPVHRDAIERMARIIIHRGPDDEGYFIDGPLGFGFRRLSIIDQTEKARICHQCCRPPVQLLTAREVSVDALGWKKLLMFDLLKPEPVRKLLEDDQSERQDTTSSYSAL